MNFKTLCAAILLFSFALMMATFCERKTDGFTILGISSNRPFNPLWEIKALKEEERQEVKSALAQPYYYLASGSQTFVFASQDGNYVVKFFKERLFTSSYLLNALPLPFFLHKFRDKRNWKRADKLSRDFASYKMAFDELKDETKLLFIHLNRTPLHETLYIRDKLGIEHRLELDKFSFILQKRAEPSYQHIQRLMHEGKTAEAKEAVKKMVFLVKSRCEKGFRDRDPDIRTNCGFVEGEAIKIDVGRLEKNASFKDPQAIQEEIKTATHRFKLWIETFHPRLMESYDEAIH